MFSIIMKQETLPIHENNIILKDLVTVFYNEGRYSGITLKPNICLVEVYKYIQNYLTTVTQEQWVDHFAKAVILLTNDGWSTSNPDEITNMSNIDYVMAKLEKEIPALEGDEGNIDDILIGDFDHVICSILFINPNK